jgi:cytochrome P450
VIMNQCAVHFDTGVFGEDAESFVPERWVRDGEKKAGYMERHILQFGYGPRICIGKHITNVEMYKLLPTILRDFEFEGVGGKAEDQGLKDWNVWAGWFHQQKGVDVKVKRRRERAEGVVVELGEWGVSQIGKQ